MATEVEEKSAHRARVEKLLASQADGSVNEQSLALAWQIPRSAIATIRKSRLREHWHWKYGPSKNHGDVRITKEGVEELKRWVVPPDKPQLVEAPPEVLVPVKPGEPVPGEENIVTVHRIPANPRMLICRDAHGNHVSVRVNSNVLFRAGMKIDVAVQCVRLAVASGTAAPVYAFRGKYPRSYGRW